MRRVLSISIFVALICLTIVLPITNELMFCNKGLKANANETKITNEESVKKTLNITASSSILMEANSGKIIYADYETERRAPASMTKLITLLVVMEQIDGGKLKLDDDVLVSEYAASQEGSECFLDANQNYKVRELIKSIAVASANDSCVALAEACYGSESMFVNEMNKTAAKLGMNNSHFENCTGLDSENHYSTAYDMCLAIKALSKYELISELEKTWLYDMEHSKGRVTSLTNTNRLIRSNPDCYMAKTGHTDNAKYCITVYGKRNKTELIACVMGVNESKTRFEEVTKLLNYGFTNFESKKILDSAVEIGKVKINGGKIKELPYYASKDIFLFNKKGEEVNSEVKYNVSNSTIKAPTQVGQVVGSAEVIVNGELYDKANLEIRESVKQNSYGEIVTQLLA